MESVSKYFKEEKDFLFRKGEATEKAKNIQEFVENLMIKLGLTDQQVAIGANVDLEFVKKMRAELKK